MTGSEQTDVRGRRGPLLAALSIGMGLALAPAVFGMFTAAPLGGQMIEEFRPFMRHERLDAFEQHLATIDDAAADVRERVVPELEADGALTEDGLAGSYPATATFLERWPTIRSEMTDLLDDIGANVGNFAAVDALPPFPLFPWFFVVPGLAVAVAAAAALWSSAATGRGPVVALAVIGLGLVAAPAVFGMFTRAPQGGRMIDDMRPLMTREQVTAVQDHFVTLGAAEGEVRTELLGDLADTGADPGQTAPAAAAFLDRWPTIAADMAPMVGAMGDNLDNFAAIDGLPPFALFPWFFVLPGLLLVGLAAGGGVLPGSAAPAESSHLAPGGSP